MEWSSRKSKGNKAPNIEIAHMLKREAYNSTQKIEITHVNSYKITSPIDNKLGNRPT